MNTVNSTLLNYITEGEIISFQQIEPQIICMYVPKLKIDCLINFNFKTLQTSDHEHNIQNFNLSLEVCEYIRLKYL